LRPRLLPLSTPPQLLFGSSLELTMTSVFQAFCRASAGLPSPPLLRPTLAADIILLLPPILFERASTFSQVSVCLGERLNFVSSDYHLLDSPSLQLFSRKSPPPLYDVISFRLAPPGVPKAVYNDTLLLWSAPLSFFLFSLPLRMRRPLLPSHPSFLSLVGLRNCVIRGGRSPS